MAGPSEDGPAIDALPCPGVVRVARTKCVALLRGINVGGRNRLAMADLRELLVGLGHTDVATVLQSGNVVFRPGGGRTAAISVAIEDGLKSGLGLSVRVIVRSAEEIEAALAADPFLVVATDPSRHFIGFLADDPSSTGVGALRAVPLDVDRVDVVGRHAYLWCPDGLSKSPLFKFAWDRQLGTAVTMRNLATVTKVQALLG